MKIGSLRNLRLKGKGIEKKEESHQDLGDSIKLTTYSIMAVSEGEWRSPRKPIQQNSNGKPLKSCERFWTSRSRGFKQPETDLTKEGLTRGVSSLNCQKFKTKGISKNFKENKCHVTFMETPIKLTTDFSAETFGLEWNDIFKVVKGKKKKTLLPNFTRVSKLSFRNEVGNKGFPR